MCEARIEVILKIQKNSFGPVGRGAGFVWVDVNQPRISRNMFTKNFFNFRRD